jgi:Cu/Ag efflux protein CusF
VDTRQNINAPTGAESREDTMRRAKVVLLFAAFVVAGLALGIAFAKGQEKAPAAAKEGRWHGVIVRIDKDASTMDVRKGTIEKKIHWDSSTKWTEGTKVVDMSEFKEGTDVICLGTYPSGSVVMNATRIDLRRK